MRFSDKEGKLFTITPIGSMDRQAWAMNYAGWVNDSEITKFLYQGTIPTSIAKCEKLYDTLTDENHCVFNIRKWAPMGLGECIGIVGVFGIYWPSRIGEYRILIGDQEFWGRGIGQKTLELMNDIAFERLGLYKFWLGYNASHKRAEGAYTKAGFKHECIIKRHHFKNGTYNDLIRLCMFREDYEKWKISQQDSLVAEESDTPST